MPDGFVHQFTRRVRFLLDVEKAMAPTITPLPFLAMIEIIRSFF